MEKRKKLVRIICLILAVLMVGTIVGPLFSTAFADETPAEKKERLRQELTAIEQNIEANKNDASKAQQLKQYYQMQANNIAAQIEAQKEDIANCETDLTTKQDELSVQMGKVEQSELNFKARLKGMYEMSRQSPLATLFGLEDFSQMLSYTEYLQRISVSDTDLIAELEAQQAELERQAAEIQTQLDELNAKEAELEQLAADYAASIQAAQIQADEAAAAAEAQELARADKQKEYDAAVAEWIAWTTSSTNETYANGDFQWPIPGYYSLSSDYGVTRTIYGRTDVHRGMDIPAPAGTPIYAAADGVVSTNNHWTYGTSVKISHSPSLATIYGHMTSRAAGITDGAVVTKGQVIGYVGSTGNSTGNHLHFEVNVNGNPTSARPYLDPACVARLVNKY